MVKLTPEQKEMTNNFRHTLDAPNEEADKKLLYLIKVLGITEEDLEAVGDDI